MKFDIPKKCEIRWQAALAVLEDLQEDTTALFGMENYGSVKDWYKHDCGSTACFAGWMLVAPYCRELEIPKSGWEVVGWLSPDEYDGGLLWRKIFSPGIDKGSRAKTLAYLKKTLKQTFKKSTGKTLRAPLTFYIQ